MHGKHTSNGLLLGVAWSAIAPGLLISATTLAANRVVTANSNMTFSPSTLTIAAGDTVTFRNGSGTHNVRSDPGSVTAFRCANGCDATGGNGNLSSAAWSGTVFFPTAGSIRYFCERHGGPGGVGMAGQITVTAYIAKQSNFNADNRSDILWRNTSSGLVVDWMLADGLSADQKVARRDWSLSICRAAARMAPGRSPDVSPAEMSAETCVARSPRAFANASEARSPLAMRR